MASVKVLLALIFLASTSAFASPEQLDLRAEVGRFFALKNIEGRWAFKSVDERCDLVIEYWKSTEVVMITLQDQNGVLGTSFRAASIREETVPLFNDKTYLSYYSDFSKSPDHVFVVEGVYEFNGIPGDKATQKTLYLSRALQVYSHGLYRYVTYGATDRSGTESKSCVF